MRRNGFALQSRVVNTGNGALLVTCMPNGALVSAIEPDGSQGVTAWVPDVHLFQRIDDPKEHAFFPLHNWEVAGWERVDLSIDSSPPARTWAD